jgi:benzoate-CoA ligase family protein
MGSARHPLAPGTPHMNERKNQQMQNETALAPPLDTVPKDAPGSQEIGFSVPSAYNASAILLDNLERAGSRCAIMGPAGSRTYAALAADACAYGAGLLSLGLQRGDRVLLFLDDTPAYPAALFGAIGAGLVPLLINTLTPPDLLQFYLADSGAKVAICDAVFVDRFNSEACRETKLQQLVVSNGQAVAPGPVQSLTAAAWLGEPPPRFAPADTRRDDMAFWMYSSGSTGRPKGIVHLQHDMLFTHLSYAHHLLKLTGEDICFSVPKIFFAYGLGNSITFPFAVGASSVLLPGQPKPAAIFETIARYRPTVFYGLPTLYTALSAAPEAGAADLSSLRLCVSAAEILAAEVANAWKKISGLEIMEGLGSSEVLHIYLSNSAEAKRLGSAGKRVPGYELALRDSDGREVSDDEEGVLWVRGDSNAPCYWNRPDKTAETMREGGWIYTGDRFMRDTQGFHFFRGRADDLVKISGQWVYPLEVELCLANHPRVRECAVVATEGADRLTTLRAFVVLSDGGTGSEVTTQELQDFVKTRLLPYKYPRVVTYLEDLPKTGSGKIDRQSLLKHHLPSARAR